MATHEPVNFSGSSSNRTAWRRVSSDGGAQLRADNVGGKSPGKSRKFSLFKKTSSKEDLLSGGSGRFERSSGRGKRKTSKGSSSRDSSLDGLSSDNEPRNQVEIEGRTASTAVSGGVASSSKPPIAKSQARDYTISDSQELEHRSTSELSARKVQKINKELTKQNNQLSKDVDTLRRENETLQSEKLKLKSENKTLERELRRVSSKGEVQRILKNGPAETDLEEVAAEQRMLERDEKLDSLKRKLEKQLEYFQQRDATDKLERMEDLLPESEKQSNSGGVWDSKTALKRLVEEQDISSRLRKENMELKSKLASLEADLEQLVKAKSSPKNSRIKPGNFFRRSKRGGGESQKDKLTPASADSQTRPRSPDIPLSELLTFDTPSSLEGTPIHKSLPAHISPNQSPKLEARDKQNAEIQELKARIKSAEEDKNSAEKRNKELEAELQDVRSQLEALQVKAEKGRKDSEEVDKLKKSLKMANSEKTSLSGQIQHLRKELDELKTARKSSERSMTELLKKKESRIEELEMDCNRVKKEREKLQKELESSKVSVAELKRKDSRIDELEEECSKARKECEKLQKELESAKAAAISESKSEPKLTTPPTSVHTHTAAKPPTGASRHTSPSHKPVHSVGKIAPTSSPKAASSPVSSTSSPKVASSPVSSTSDSVFGEIESSSNKATSDARKLSTDSNKSAGEPVTSRATRKSSTESVGEKKPENQIRSRRNSKSPPRLRKRRSSTELIELFEHSKETLKPAEPNVKRNTSFANLATSTSHRAKVAATRAMFEGKKDDELAKAPTTTTATTVSLRSESKGGANRNIYRRTWTGDITQLRRSTNYTEPIPTVGAAIPEGKEAVMLHTKSQSVDTAQQFKPTPSASAASDTSTSRNTISGSPKHTTSTTTTVAPSKPVSLNLTSSTPSKKVGAAIVHQHSVSSTPSSDTPSSSTSLTVTPASTPSASKVSKITIKSSSSSSTSPQLNARKEVRETTVGTSMRAEKVIIPVSPSGNSVNVSVGQRSRVISSSSTAATPVKSPTMPLKLPTTPLKTPTTPISVSTTPVKSSNVNTTDSNNKRTNSVVVTSNGVAKAPSYIPSYVRSNTVSGGESATSNRVKVPVVRSQTAVKFTVTSTGSTPSTPQPTRTNIVSTQAQPEHGILKRGSSLLNSPSDLKKTSSLLDIPENIDEANESSSNSHTSPTSVGNSNPPPSSGSSLGVSGTPTAIHGSPVQTRIQRRRREDRPKTMYAGANRSETVSLVRLISKYQEQERREKGQTSTNTATISAPASTQIPAVNGNASPTPAAATTFSSSAGSSTSSGSNTNVVTARTSNPRPRPQSYYGGSSDLIGSGFSTPATVPAPSNMSSGRKPKKARRSQTVALGGINRQSKKAMLLRWCQIATDHYDNVSIDNFGESFADGLAFCALLHHFIPDQIPYSKLDVHNREQNFRIAFEEAEKVGIPRLLDVEDMVALPIPDWMSVMTYITFVYNKFGKTETSVA